MEKLNEKRQKTEAAGAPLEDASALSTNEIKNTRQSIVVSSSCFDNIRTHNCLYVDKTQHIYDTILNKCDTYFFFVRPRRFGKSLLCSTIANLFRGKAKEELFKGLWIHNSKVWDFEKEEHPVLHLDMSEVAGVNSTVNSFENDVKEMLNDILMVHDITLPPDNFPNRTALSYALIKLKLKYKKPVVVIIDEYDKPVLDLLDSPEHMKAVYKSLQTFYSILKSEESNLRLVFITGLTNSMEMRSSTLNNIDDISFDLNAGSLVGYTESEIQVNFADHIKALKVAKNIQDDEDVMNRLRGSYNGYRFGLDTANGKLSDLIYNPLQSIIYSKIYNSVITGVYPDLHQCCLPSWSQQEPITLPCFEYQWTS